MSNREGAHDPASLTPRFLRRQVHFIDRPEQFDSVASVAQMEASLGKVVGLAQRLHEMHCTLATDPQYLSRIATQERQPRWDEEGGGMK